ncbi:hypothetical protein AYO39_01460 [Actinobacteria bacterium SCGC AG-212-D09]|nr:hypothetical protein AYO39_01460 [Actinobacteria bacterium SCGC AG-212-D09]
MSRVTSPSVADVLNLRAVAEGVGATLYDRHVAARLCTTNATVEVRATGRGFQVALFRFDPVVDRRVTAGLSASTATAIIAAALTERREPKRRSKG